MTENEPEPVGLDDISLNSQRQLSVVGREINEIPEFLQDKFGAETISLDLSWNNIRFVCFFSPAPSLLHSSSLLFQCISSSIYLSLSISFFAFTIITAMPTFPLFIFPKGNSS